jgi:hypothetical protein
MKLEMYKRCEMKKLQRMLKSTAGNCRSKITKSSSRMFVCLLIQRKGTYGKY